MNNNFMFRFCLFMIFISSISAVLVGGGVEKSLLPDDPETGIFLGKGMFGRVFLLDYDGGAIAYKQSFRTVDSFTKDELKANINEICANKEVFNPKLITPLYGAFLDKNDKLVLIMEPLLGSTLERAINFSRSNIDSISIDWIKRVIARTALGIAHIHKMGWTWNDGHLNNIYIDIETGDSFLGDFGKSERIIAKNDPNIEDDWRSFNAVISNTLNLIQRLDNHNVDSENLENLRQYIKNNASEMDNKIDALKSDPFFNDFDWETMRSKNDLRHTPIFMGEKHQAYLSSLYPGDNAPLNRKPSITKSHSIDSFVIDSDLLSKFKARSIEELCNHTSDIGSLSLP